MIYKTCCNSDCMLVVCGMASNWLLPSFAEEGAYVLDINSADHVAENRSPVQFTVNIANVKSLEKSCLFLSPGARVSVGTLVMPNNVESFPVIDTQDNQSAAFFSMRLTYTDSNEPHDYAVNYMPHGVITTDEALAIINDRLRLNFLETNDKTATLNICGETFSTNCFYAYRDEVTDFVHLHTATLADDNPFCEVYEKTAKPDTPKKVQRVDIWMSDELQHFFGKLLPNGDLHWTGKPYRVEKHGYVLDSLIAETSLTNGKHYMQTHLAAYPNRTSMLAVKSDLIGSNQMGTLMVAPIPGDSSQPISYTQNNIKWMDVTRFGQIDSFRISIHTIEGRPLPYRGGCILLVLKIQNAPLL